MSYQNIVIPGVPHHIVLRGNNRRNLFSYPWEYVEFVHLVEEARDRYECPVHVMSLMKNHVHIKTTPPSERALSLFGQSFAQRYALRRNRRRSSSGKLFEQRFYRFPVFGDEGIAAVSAYIELNPVRAGLCDEPGASQLTTYNLHAGRPEQTIIPASLWTPTDWYNRMGPENYVRWVANVRARDIKPPRIDPRELRLRRPNGTRAA